jgi:putative SOS response-associated peptidase YedK
MCGRFTLSVPAEQLQQTLGFEILSLADWKPRYNIAPTQPIVAVLDQQPDTLNWLRWGLVSAWSRADSRLPLLINARAETLMQKPAFRGAFRCLILADGFYEWKKQPGSHKAQPYFFQRVGGGLFAFAGLWQSWRSPAGEELRSAAIVTCAANECVATVHERMPVMLDFPAAWAWLSDAEDALLTPYPAEALQVVAVGMRVNDAQYDAPDCLIS